MGRSVSASKKDYRQAEKEEQKQENSQKIILKTVQK